MSGDLWHHLEIRQCLTIVISFDLEFKLTRNRGSAIWIQIGIDLIKEIKWRWITLLDRKD